MTRNMQTEFWTNPLGERFRLVHWPAPGEAKALIVIHHGLGEHAGRYQSWVDGLGDLPVDVWSYDARGHGESLGQRGDAPGFEGFARDFEAMLKLFLEKSGQEHVIVFGHSMGAAVVAHYATTRPTHPAITGLILSAPPFHVPRTLPNRIKIAIGRSLGAVVPRLAIASGIKSKQISSVPDEVKAYEEDPLLHDKISARLGVSLIDDGEAALVNADKLKLPCLMYQGTGDTVVDPSGPKAFADKLGPARVEFHTFNGLHELHHEKTAVKAELFKTVRAWILAHLDAAKAAA